VDDKLYPLIGTLVGGLLTIFGGAVLAYWNRSLARQQERNKIVREKLEEAANHGRQTLLWAEDLYRDLAVLALGGRLPEKERKLNPAVQLVFIAKIYSPELIPSVNRFVAVVDTYHRLWTEFMAFPQLFPGATNEDRAAHGHRVGEAHGALSPAYERLVDEVSQLVRSRYL